MIRNRLLIRCHRALALLLLACVPALTQAGPASKVYTPQVSYGEWELELRGGAQQWPGQSGDRAQQYVTDIGYGIAPRWFTDSRCSTPRCRVMPRGSRATNGRTCSS